MSARALAAEGRLRRLLRINKRLNSELRLPRLLEMIVDTVIELTDAERGFLLLEDEHRQLEVKVARNIDQRTLETAEFELSRSIARQAAAGGEPIVTIDAAGDARFREALSVSDLHLRSVLAVPLVDQGARRRARSTSITACARARSIRRTCGWCSISPSRRRSRSRTRACSASCAAASARSRRSTAGSRSSWPREREELSGIKQELRDNREALAVRYDYRNIIGRTPRMLDLFRLLDRITDTTLPVVIQGESGTGKELVARAIHANGPRRDRPFVGENCAAIPETLLESTLFGHVRGAFTGAERDTRGLFEVADGGTLFLDEVARDVARHAGQAAARAAGGRAAAGRQRAHAQGRRPHRGRDATAISARMVEEGKFREDLFFRLNVAQIALPPLRDRRDDIPLMVEHFLAKAGEPPPGGPRRSRSIRRRSPGSSRYRWPGNVRELENEITRADALSGDRIGVADLSPEVAAAGRSGRGRRRRSRQPAAQAARRAPGTFAAARGAGPGRQQPDQGRRDPRAVALRPAEEAQAVQFQRVRGAANPVAATAN